MSASRAILVVAKAPVPGLVKTRLMAGYSATEAATLASAALLDTLDTALSVPEAIVVVSLAGVIDDAVGSDDLRTRLSRTTVVEQHGDTLGDRLDRAHRDAAAQVGGGRVMQIGMDTPQVTVELLVSGLDALDDHDAALGLATDGGWWGLAVSGARGAHVLPGVAMSQSDTGERTADALRRGGCSVAFLKSLTDVDHPADVTEVAETCAPTSAFARISAELRSAVAHERS
ncbi:TIGR04282 family arsenosugar biosynthesis glycosyltransferase [Williamsia herbipolensis]|uniref:TIGR04282 family arsenosugar biosynthesis glycosyltransferase n=1 Tax=Williamsia herbipolensis TaxID=1603258 RepID=UPI0005F8114D|nr:DUF2064 domain-containing protein [Williamsia herbipolensis]